MRHLSWLPPLAALVLTSLLAACSSGPRPQLPSTAPPEAAAAAQVPDDPVTRRVAESEAHFAQGVAELELGHLDQARQAFDRALEVLMQAPGGARVDERLRDQFDRLVDRISAREATALSQGDGFTEHQRYEAASIDQILEMATLESTPDADLERTVRADLETGGYDIPIALNPQVLRYVDLFQGRLRDFLEDGLTRGTRYLPMIRSVLRAEGLPLDLAYVPLVESAFKTSAYSRAHARGIWQFIRSTGLEQGLRQDWYVDERSDPEKSTYAAARYLATLHRMFDGDWHLALASYNGGPGRVRRAMERSGRSTFWELSERLGMLPRETREYVPMILAAIVIAKNPRHYGFDIEPQDPLEYDRLTVPAAVDLRRVAEWADVSIDEIQDLNPALRRWTTPLGYPEFQLRVPAGTAGLLADRLETLPPTELTALNRHTVRRGDSLSVIARALNVRTADLAEANQLRLTDVLHPGQELIVPRPPASLPPGRPDRSAPVAETVSGDPAPLVHRVQRGDTLSRLARVYETTVDQIKNWNNLRTDRIRIGDRLTILSVQAPGQ